MLLVEDEDTLRFSVSKMLRQKGYSVVEAHDGSAAIDILGNRKGRIDVMVLDLTIRQLQS